MARPPEVLCRLGTRAGTSPPVSPGPAAPLDRTVILLKLALGALTEGRAGTSGEKGARQRRARGRGKKRGTGRRRFGVTEMEIDRFSRGSRRARLYRSRTWSPRAGIAALGIYSTFTLSRAPAPAPAPLHSRDFLRDRSLSLVYETIPFLSPTLGKAEQSAASFKKLIIPDGERKRAARARARARADRRLFLIFLLVQRFFSYALNDCCFHGESFRELSRKPFV